MSSEWVDQVLGFWFDEIGPEEWFGGGTELDETIRRRFGKLYDELSADAPKEAENDPRAALAAIILFDQFPRNMFRGSPKAFATDDLAARIAREAESKKLDEALEPQQRLFFYMPFEHSEVYADQERAVMLFKSLGDEEALRYAEEHRDIVQRFGRFPHRNRALNRESTAEERTFLEEHKGFGQ